MEAYYATLTQEEKRRGKELLFACLRGNKEEARRIIKSGNENIINHRNLHGESPLYFAARSSVELFKLLVRRGADPYIKTGSNQTIFHQAGNAGKTEILSYLEKHTDKSKFLKFIGLDLKAFSGYTPAHCAANHGKFTFLLEYIDMGGKVNIRNSNGANPLHTACTRGAVQSALVILRNGKFDINERMFSGDRRTPFCSLIHCEVDLGFSDYFKSAVREFILRGGKVKGCADCKRRKCRPEFVARMKFVAEEKVRIHQLVNGTASAETLNEYAEPIAPHLGVDACSELAKGNVGGVDAAGGGRGRTGTGGGASPFLSKRRGFMGRFSRANSSTTIVTQTRDRPKKSNALTGTEGSPSVSDPGQEDLSSEDTISQVNDSPADGDDDNANGSFGDGDDDELQRLDKVVEEDEVIERGKYCRDDGDGDESSIDSDSQASPLTTRLSDLKIVEEDVNIGSNGKHKSSSRTSRSKKKGKSPAGRELLVE